MQEQIKVIEAILFCENSLVEVSFLSKLLKLKEEDILNLVKNLNDYYIEKDSTLRVREVENKIELMLDPHFFHETLGEYMITKRKIPKGLLETLTIIAYKQPITKTEVEEVRGVNSQSYIKKLREDDFIEEVGRKDTVGQPILFGTTEQFLKQFDLRSLSDLPSLEEIKQFDFLEED